MSNAISKRIFYACQAFGLAKDGTTSFTSLKGLQSVGVNTRYNLEPVFEEGQISLYDQPENIPDVEITMEKVMDGTAPLWLQATNGATQPTLVGRSNLKCSFAASIYSDLQSSASGTPITQMYCSGMFVSQITYTFPVQGNFSESCTFIGNNKQWLTSAFTFSPTFDNNDSPLSGTASGNVNRRQHLTVYPNSLGRYTKFPTDIPGISSSGTNNTTSDGSFLVHFQNIRTSTNLGREPMYELGRKGFYHRYVAFPVEVRTDYEFMSTSGDLLNASDTATTNVSNQTLSIATLEGLYIDLGSKNKCTSVSYTGGNAGRQGGNVSQSYSYLNYNDFSIFHTSDPSGL